MYYNAPVLETFFLIGTPQYVPTRLYTFLSKKIHNSILLSYGHSRVELSVSWSQSELKCGWDNFSASGWIWEIWEWSESIQTRARWSETELRRGWDDLRVIEHESELSREWDGLRVKEDECEIIWDWDEVKWDTLRVSWDESELRWGSADLRVSGDEWWMRVSWAEDWDESELSRE